LRKHIDTPEKVVGGLLAALFSAAGVFPKILPSFASVELVA